MRSIWQPLSSYIYAEIHFDICNPVLSSFMGPCPHLKPSSQLQVVLVSRISVLESRRLPIAHYWIRKEILRDCLSFSLPVQNCCHLCTPVPALCQEQWVLGSQDFSQNYSEWLGLITYSFMFFVTCSGPRFDFSLHYLVVLYLSQDKESRILVCPNWGGW